MGFLAKGFVCPQHHETTTMRTKLHSASACFLSLCLSSLAYAQPAPAPAPAPDVEPPSDEVPVEDDIDEGEGDEVTPVQGEPAPPSDQPPTEQAPPAEQAPPEEVPADEFFEEEGVENPNRPPAKGMGAVWGVVTDSKGEPVLEGPVEVVGKKKQVVTDFDGRYRLELPPGNYSLRFFYEFHQPMRVEITVEEGEVKQVDAQLKPDEEAPVEEFVVEAKLEEASLESQILKRQQSASVSDGIGRQEISKTPDSDAAAAAQRVVGANIVDGRFVYVRGLGERYSNALLFGSPLPSPEPDRAAVPLDLFPALVLDSVNIVKTFTPDMPGDFAGGSVQIETRGVPEKFVFSVSLNGAYNTRTTFKDRLTYDGSSTDWLGLDDGSRALPDGVPSFRLKRNSRKPGGDLVRDSELVDPAKELNSRMSAHMANTPPDHGGSVVVGNGWLLGGKQKLGALASLNYSHSYQIRREVLKEYKFDPSQNHDLKAYIDYDTLRGQEDVNWGAFGSVTYQPNDKNELRFITLHSQSGADETSFYQGFNDYTKTRVSVTDLDWVQRGLSLGQLSGRHTFDALNAANLGWDLAVARATRNEPDRRTVVYEPNKDLGGWVYRDGTDSGRHFFADQHETSYNMKLDYTQPIVDTTKIKLGGLASLKDRSFEARRLTLREGDGTFSGDARACLDDDYSLDCPDSLFVNENIDSEVLRLEEGTDANGPGTDAYDAHLNIYAGYLMGEIEVAKPLRAIVGGRVEHTDQAIEPFDQFGGDTHVDGADLQVTNFLPSAGIVYSATSNTKTRISYTRTLARPQLRELAPFSFSDYFGGRTVNGNPDLVLTRINNVDTRFEYFPTLREVLAFSVFYKHFEDPIEPIFRASSETPRVTFVNSPSAELIGLELEGRKQLDFIDKALADFQLISNVTLTWSRTQVEQTGQNTITSLSRPLVNQAPWVLNVSLDYENDVGTHVRGLYNVAGETLVEVGADQLPDAYKHSEHSLDLVASQKFAEHWQVKAQAQNVLNAETLVTQGKKELGGDENTTRRYKDGVTLSVGLSFTY